MAGLAGLFLLLGLAAWTLEAGRRRADVANAAATVAGAMRRAALRAIVEGRAAGVAFRPGPDSAVIPLVDRAGDGLDPGDVAGPPLPLGRDAPAAAIAPPPWPRVAGIPPSGAPLRGTDPPVRFGPRGIATFTPEGRARSGHVTIADGRSALCAVVVHGASARIRVLCYERAPDRWRER
ncbi:MAG: hypothetical protein D6738_09035 [Acidobacteria bacterium]|nr:MAG: hypothetical protein D6738_09035 [Acidobacteriota bacterium]